MGWVEGGGVGGRGWGGWKGVGWVEGGGVGGVDGVGEVEWVGNGNGWSGVGERVGGVGWGREWSGVLEVYQSFDFGF